MEYTPSDYRRDTVTCWEPLLNFFGASIAPRHVPQTWRATKGVFIPKPGRNDHIKDKGFRPISLPSFVLKTLEQLVDRFLKTGPLVQHLLAASQYAYRDGRSTETPLHHLMVRVEKQLETKEYATGTFLDIEGDCDSMSSMTNRP
jgi:hypothetical protein